MRADRLLSILLLLQNYERITASSLASRLEVSERTIYRDIEALSIAGIPIYMERGTGGGISLSEEYRAGITSNLTETEMNALLVAPPKLLSDLGWKGASESAMLKLLTAVPFALRRQMQNVTDRIYVDPAGWNRKDEPVPCLKAVQDAVFNDRYIRFIYQKPDGSSERVAAALGLVSKASTWYMVAEVQGDIRSFRVSRMEEAEALGKHAVRPPKFRLDEYWRQSVASLSEQVPKYPVVLLCDSEMISALPRIGHWSRVECLSEVEGTGWRRVEMLFEREVDALKCILENSPHFQVVEPESLRQQAVATLEAALRLYDRQEQG